MNTCGTAISWDKARIDIEAGDAQGMVVIKHQPVALLVGVVHGIRPRARIRHVGNISEAHTRLVRSRFFGRSKPLVGGAVTHPRPEDTMEMNGSAVLGVRTHPITPLSGLTKNVRLDHTLSALSMTLRHF